MAKATTEESKMMKWSDMVGLTEERYSVLMKIVATSMREEEHLDKAWERALKESGSTNFAEGATLGWMFGRIYASINNPFVEAMGQMMKASMSKEK